MDQLITLTCPQPSCNHHWQIDYADLQAYRTTYRSAARKASRREEYVVRCPKHGEMVTIVLTIEEP